MTELLVPLFCKVAAVTLVAGLLWMLAHVLIEDWRNPPWHWTRYANQQFHRNQERIRLREERRQRLIDQL